ncbi:phosphatidylinositol 3-kinase C2 domain-containing subunit gamma [Pyxicephalus adspersus]|uniref:phosphatidylinositol 3-kinase C2 domain-containing subunit gamma n=1 Tax=Pyxicephalus adspersus TaxID=30357 RepID=UPI003B5A147C
MMDPAFHIGFSDHVTNLGTNGQIPPVPSPAYEVESMAQSAQTYASGYGPPAIGFDSMLSDLANLPVPYHMTGTPAPQTMFDTPALHHMEYSGTSAPHHMIGTPVSHHLTSTLACHQRTSMMTPYHMTGTPAPHHMNSTAAPHHMTGTASLPPSYGFVTNNWMEERQSWYPEEPPPTENICDPSADPELQTPENLGGFRIGFENFGHFSHIDPTTHYHQIDCPGTTHLTPNVGGRMRVRSLTLRENALRGHDEGKHTRRFSMHDVYPRAPNYYQQTQITDWKIPILETSSDRNLAFTAFCGSVKLIRSKFSAADVASNPGRLWSVAIPFPDEVEDFQVEISVYVENLETPLLFLLRDSVRIEELLSHILHKLHPSVPSLYPSLQSQFMPGHIPPADYYPDQNQNYPSQNPQPSSQSLYPSLDFLCPQSQVSPPYPPQYPEPTTRDGYFLRICGRDEYLQSGFSLRSHSSLQRLTSIHLQLHHGGDVTSSLARSVEDDCKQLELSDRQEHLQYWVQIRTRIHSAVSQYEESVRQYLHDQHAGIGPLLEAVKEVCYLLRSVETKEISEGVQRVRCACYQPAQMWAPSPQGKTPAQEAVTTLSGAISHLINMYSRSFYTDFQAGLPDKPHRLLETRDHLTFHLHAAHNLPDKWATSQNSVFYISCSVTYSGRKICPEMKSRNVKVTQSLFSRLVWDEVMTFPLPLAALPYETMLVLRLYAVTDAHSSFLAWACLPLYTTQQTVQGSLLLNMISHAEPPPSITPGAFDVTLPTLVTVQVEFPETAHTFHRPPAEDSTTLLQDSSLQMEFLAQRGSVLLLSEVDKQCLWYYRHCAHKTPGILPLLLGSAPGWDPPTVSAMYRLLQDWSFSHPLEGLSLLSPSFSDENIRDVACRQIGKMSDDELLEFLPQLVQAVKFDWCLDSALVKLLLQRSLQSVQIAHKLFWLLTDATNESHYRRLYQTLLAALQFCMGSAMNAEFSRETKMMAILQSIGEKVKNAPEEKRQETLKLGLKDLDRFFQEVKSCRLPLDPAIVVKGINRELCSYFKSNARPLKITFLSADRLGPDIHLIFKTGDDIRQDMLILQIINLMDRIWLYEGLDLRMVTYHCLSTGKKQGLIQMVPDSTTLAKIQNAGGIFGPLKDTSIKKWFGSNKTAADNFLYSCAGWCVATFILGICDRHNDNIMLTNTGHMFHIDFGKILGNAQMFGKVKRDRAPFIFTSEMENFITEEGRSPQRAQEFVDLCCCAYNIIRKHSTLLITALELMLQAGLPELSSVHDLKYVHDNLRPYDSDLQATSYFTSKITESLQCVSVKLNFLIHAFANMNPTDAAKLAGQVNPSLPKFIRKTAVKGLKKIYKMSERILTDLGMPIDTEPSSAKDGERGIQLHFSFSPPVFSVLLKHLRNIYFSDGSVPTASVTISLHYRNTEISREKVKSPIKSPAPTFNKLVQFSVQQLDGNVMKFEVKSKGIFLGMLSIPLSTVPLNKDIWYRLGG